MPVTQENIDAITNEVKAIAPSVSALEGKLKNELANLRSEIDTARKADKLDPLFVNKVDTIAASVETLQASIEEGKAVSARVDALEAVNKRPGGGGFAGEDAAKEAKAAYDWHKQRLVSNGQLNIGTVIEPDAEGYGAYCAAFPAYMRARSDGAMKPAVQAAMQTGSDPDGGYLVPVTTSSRVIERVYETSALRALATVETIGGKELAIPRDEGEFGNGGWVGETTAPSETTTSQFGESKISAHEMFAEPRVTQSMLEDAAFDIEAWVARKVGDKFGRIEATAFFTGNGNNKPRGLLTYANYTTPGVTENGKIEQIVSGHATQVTADGLYNLVYSLKDYYLANACFVTKRLTVRDILKLKDGTGEYMWKEGDIKTGQPASLMGYVVKRAEDMTTVAASALAIAFGDFRQAYTVVDRLGITLLRDNLTSKPFIKFYNRRRVGGDVVNFEAVKLQKISA